ncbi:hypothetical protein F3087_45715 [Nocardia colli]|uniref:Uncharacterized protein n=1 Tax=Nocardia colli TaxID=2545717 RepID=A0A5N0DKG7_9NOCA|nr:hypothetical protein [Nocardia colli]KAA8877176.1 hypothetical protein F3087_45715 [Nocardia colli]
MRALTRLIVGLFTTGATLLIVFVPAQADQGFTPDPGRCSYYLQNGTCMRYYASYPTQQECFDRLVPAMDATRSTDAQCLPQYGAFNLYVGGHY